MHSVRSCKIFCSHFLKFLTHFQLKTFCSNVVTASRIQRKRTPPFFYKGCYKKKYQAFFRSWFHLRFELVQRSRIFGLACNHTMDRITCWQKGILVWFFDHIFSKIFGEKWWCPCDHYFWRHNMADCLITHSPSWLHNFKLIFTIRLGMRGQNNKTDNLNLDDWARSKS